MVKIEMLDDDGIVTEEIQDVHVCVGDPEACMDAAWCETDGKTATPETPIYVWTTAIGMTYFVCGDCLSGDSYARLAS